MSRPRDTIKDAPSDTDPQAPESIARVRTSSTNPGLGPQGSDTNPGAVPPVVSDDRLARLDGPLPAYKVTSSDSDGLDAAAFHSAARPPPRSGYDTLDDGPTPQPPEAPPTPGTLPVVTEPHARRDEITQDSERKARSKRAMGVGVGVALLVFFGVGLAVKLNAGGPAIVPSATATEPSATTPAPTASAPAPMVTGTATLSTAMATVTTPTASAPTAKPSASSTSAAPTATSTSSAPAPSTSDSSDPLSHFLKGH